MADVELIVAAFNDEEAARRALDELKMAQADGLIEIQDAAVLRKDHDGKLHIKETSDWGTGRGAAIGGVAGAAVGLIAGPALLVPVAVGALIGGLSAKWRDSGQRDDQLEKLPRWARLDRFCAQASETRTRQTFRSRIDRCLSGCKSGARGSGID